MTPSPLFQRLAGLWRDFWFTRVPPHTYALLRILTGLVGVLTIAGAWNGAFWDVNELVPELGAWYMGPWLIAHGLGTVTGLGLRWLLLVGYACLALGIGTFVIVPAMFLGSAAMLSWSWLPWSGAQELLHRLILPLIFVDSGSIWSVDAWRRARSAPDVRPLSESIWPLRLLQYQIAIMYLSSALWKFGNPDWRSGLALYYVMNNVVYQRMPGGMPSALFGVSVGLTYLTLAWEFAFPFLIWFRRTRWSMLAIGICLHLGMWATIEVGAFTPTVLVAYVAFLNPRLTERRVRRLLGSRARVEQAVAAS